jgi:LacI family transcriptional regulator, galactose operon repressor
LAKRPTMQDVADAAGVGVATVDRVLNNRAAVRTATAASVINAAQKLGYYSVPVIRHRLTSKLPLCRLGFILQKADDSFYQQLAEQLQISTENAPHVRGRAIVEFVDDLSAEKISAAMLAMQDNVDVIACVPIEHPIVSRTISELAEKGIPVVALLTTLGAQSLAGYIGVDNRQLGRTAGWLMSHLVSKPGKIAVFVGSHRYVGQEMSEIGFRSYCRENPRGHELLETSINLDDPAVAEGVTLDLLRKHPDLAGIYDAGGGREGIIAALRSDGQGRDVAVICSQLTPATQSALIDGVISAVLSLPVNAFCAATVEAMVTAFLGNPGKFQHQHIIPFEIITSENINS